MGVQCHQRKVGWRSGPGGGGTHLSLGYATEEGLQLVNVDSKQGGGKRETLFHPNGVADELE